MKPRFLSAILLCFFLSHAYTQASITVDVAKQVKILNGREAGINLNYLMDGGFTAPATPTATALKNMGIRLVRYPGGEKADNYLWSAAPWKSASPRMALLDTVNAWPTKDSRFVDKSSPERLCKPIVLDFDELMPLCKSAGAEPLIVVAYDAMYNVKTADRPTKQQLLANAVEWVRYANVVKGFGIKYWMIGNESWNLPDYNGRTTAAQYAADLIAFATAMKGVDPTIKIIANGRTDWWPTLLQSPAVSLIDILALSLYPVYNYTKGYETYRTSTQSLTGDIDAAVRAIATYAPAAHKARLKVLAAEYNSIDFEGGWSADNNLGHALCNFQIFGDLVVNPKVESACMWNTRWITNQTAEQHIFDALDKNGNLNAVGTALQVWGQNLLQTMVKAASTDARVKVYASYDTTTGNLNLFLLNKDTIAKTVRLSLASYKQQYSGARYVFSGASVSDKAPTFTRTDTIAHASDLKSLTLGPASVTVLKLVLDQARLTSFTGIVVENKVNLKWQTENDFRWRYYVVQRSVGSNNAFDSIGVQKIAFNDSTQAAYTFTDQAGAADKSIYYRLKIVSRSGAVQYSDTPNFVLTAIDSVVANLSPFSFTIVPNPVDNSLLLKTQSVRPYLATLHITDATGRIWGSEKVQVEAGSGTIFLRNLHHLPHGVYWLQIAASGKQQAIPFLKQ